MSLTVLSHCDLDLRSQVLKKCTHSRLPILFSVAVPYFVCRYILGPGESPTGSAFSSSKVEPRANLYII